MIFPQEKRDLIKYLDKNARMLRWPDWVTTIIRQLVAEHDAAEKRIADLIDAQVELVDRTTDLVQTYQGRLLETGWALNADAEWMRPLPCDPPPEWPEEMLECWM